MILKNFFKRLLTGTIFVITVTFLILFNKWTFLAFLIIANTLIIIEFINVNNKNKSKPYTASLLFLSNLSIFLIFITINYKIYQLLFILIFTPLYLFFIEALFKKNENPLKNLASTILGFVYITIPLICAILISFKNIFIENKDVVFNPYIIMGTIILVWIYDSFAYCVGANLGKHKINKRISPNKSWEGLIGGSIFIIAASIFINRISFFNCLSQTNWISIAAIVIVFGTIGDLIESLFKRSVSIKDTGSILPGHGGFLDRFDSLIFLLPWIFLYLMASEIWLLN